MGILKCLISLLLLAVMALPSAFAGGFAFDGTGVKARGMGGAFRAVADDWSAAYYNPAGYARIEDNMLAGNLAAFHNRYWAKPNILWGGLYESGFYNGQDAANEHEILNVPQGGILARFPIWGEVVMGLSGYQPFDQNQNWQLYSNIPVYSRAKFPGTQFYNNLDVVALQLTAARSFQEDRLSVGIGLAVLRADLGYANIVLRDNPMSFPINVRPYEKIPEWYLADGNGWGFGYKAGILYKVNDKIDIGAVFNGKSSIDIEGATDFKFYLGDNSFLRDNENYFPTTEEYLFVSGEVVDLTADFKTTLDLPASLAGGIALKPLPKMTLAIDAEYTFWSTFKGLNFDFSNFNGLKDTAFHRANDSLFQTDLAVPVEWDNAVRFMIGAQYQAYSFLDVRGGFTYDQSPVKEPTFIPQFIDLGNKYTLSFGLGFKAGLWNLDMATSYTHQPDLSITSMSDVNNDGMMDNLVADYRAGNYQTMLGISYRF